MYKRQGTSGSACVLASGDPMLYGIGATLARRLGPQRLEVHPHPSAFAFACARLGWPAAEVELISTVARAPESVARVLTPGRRVIVYVAMSWVAIVAVIPLSRVLPLEALAWMLAGGIIYTSGAVIYALDRPRLWPGKFGAHDLWHVFVLAGSACHFVMILFFIAMP